MHNQEGVASLRINGQNAMFTVNEGATIDEARVRRAVESHGLTLTAFRTEQVAAPAAAYELTVSDFPT
jgi:hypothetical protein